MNKLRISVLVILIIITLCVASAQAAQISVEPEYIDVSPGDTFTVNITVYPDDSEIFGIQYTIYYDNILLKPLNQNLGAFLIQDDASSNLYVNTINNILGEIEYGETRIGTNDGVTTPGVLSTIEFEARSSGVGELRFDTVKVSNPLGLPVTNVATSNSTVEIEQSPSIPFLINGYVFYENSSECNDPTVNITNLDISKEWTAERNESSNYYQIILASGADVIPGENLQFNATSPDGSQWNITEHIFTQAEVDAGGFEYNITLDIHDVFIRSDYEGAHVTGIRIDNATTEGISLDQNLTIGDTYFIKYRVLNNGTIMETVDIIVEVSNETWSEELINYQKDVNNYHNGNVTWDSTGLAPGNYNIKVNAIIPMDCNPEDNERTRNVALEAPSVLASITVEPVSVTVDATGTQTFTATPLDQYGNPITVDITWSSSNRSVGTIDPSGLFTAVAEGTAMVNATNGSVVGTASVTVTGVEDKTAPTVTDNTPTGTDVPVTTMITVTFDESMNTSSVEDAFSTNPSVTGTYAWSGDKMTFTPNANLSYSTTYDVTIATGAEDPAGNPLAEAYNWDFTTGVEDNTKPVVSITKPKKDTIKFVNNIVRGTVDDDNLNYANLTVRDNNDTIVSFYNLSIKSNKFTQRVRFAPGQNNTLELFAIDYAGNSNNASKTVYVGTNKREEIHTVNKGTPV